MQQVEQNVSITNIAEMVTFYLGESQYGIDILKVQEINKLVNWTPVPRSEAYVLGILSLRGHLVTIVDLGERLGTSKTHLTGSNRNIIVSSEKRSIGLLVDKIGDVVAVDPEQICPAPSNINGIQGRYFKGVLKADNELIAILDVQKLFENTDSNV